MASVLVNNVQNWRQARAVANGGWAKQNSEAGNKVRAFMQACGIDIPATGGYDWMVARFVFTFQECLVLSDVGFMVGGEKFDYRKEPLKVDGYAGPITLKALERSKLCGYRCWRYLKWTEISTKDPNKKATINNPVIYTRRPVVELFILMREAKGGPLSPASWFRNLRWNTFIRGAKLSQHMLGLGFDFAPHPKLNETALRLMIRKVSGGGGGIGVIEVWEWRNFWRRRIRIVGPSHVDIRKIAARWPYKTAA